MSSDKMAYQKDQTHYLFIMFYPRFWWGIVIWITFRQTFFVYRWHKTKPAESFLVMVTFCGFDATKDLWSFETEMLTIDTSKGLLKI